MSEALVNPAEEIFDVIRYFGERQKNEPRRDMRPRLAPIFPVALGTRARGMRGQHHR